MIFEKGSENSNRETNMRLVYVALLALSTVVSISSSVSAAGQDTRNAKQFYEQRERESGASGP